MLLYLCICVYINIQTHIQLFFYVEKDLEQFFEINDMW